MQKNIAQIRVHKRRPITLLSQICSIQDLCEYNSVAKKTMELWKDVV